MTGVEIVTAICQILVSGITSIASGLGTGINTLVTDLFFTGTGSDQAMSVFMIIVLAFAAVSLALALCRLIVNWLQNLGASHL